MKVALIPVTPFQRNCSLLVCERSNRAAVVDPGGDLDEILGALPFVADRALERGMRGEDRQRCL